jgi:hypothetical protein
VAGDERRARGTVEDEEAEGARCTACGVLRESEAGSGLEKCWRLGWGERMC